MWHSCAEDSSTNKIYCFGGNDGSYLSQIVEYTPATDTISVKSASFTTPRRELSCAENSLTNGIYCFGGYDGSYFNQIVGYLEAGASIFAWVVIG